MNELEKYQQYLPRNARMIADAVGFDALARLSEAFGGMRITIGSGKRVHGMENYRRLLSIVGRDDVDRLMPLAGRGGLLYVPTCFAARRAARHAAFLADYDQLRAEGESLRFIMMALCGRHGISDPVARKIIAAREASHESSR